MTAEATATIRITTILPPRMTTPGTTNTMTGIIETTTAAAMDTAIIMSITTIITTTTTTAIGTTIDRIAATPNSVIAWIAAQEGTKH